MRLLIYLIVAPILNCRAVESGNCKDSESSTLDCSSNSISATNAIPNDSESLSRFLEVEALLHSYSSGLNNFSLQINEYRSRLNFLIDQICDFHIQSLSKLSSSFKHKSDDILQNISKYSLSAVKSFLNDFPHEFIIEEAEVKQVLNTMIFIGNNRRSKLESDSLHKSNLSALVSDLKKENEVLKKNLSQTESIALSLSQGNLISDFTEDIPYQDANIRFNYFVKAGTNVLVKHDKLLKSYKEFDLTSYLTVPLDNPSCLMLPDQKVMIVGGDNRGETYRFNPKNNTLIKLKDLIYARNFSTLYCYNEYLYAFGGIIGGHWSGAVERMEWRKNGWTRIADMNLVRTSTNCYGVDNMIYLLGGSSAVVTYYDVKNNAFNTLPGVNIDKFNVGTYREVNGIIYFLTGHALTVVSSDMKLVYRNERINRNGTLYWIVKNDGDENSLIVSFEESFMRIHRDNDDFDILERVLLVT